MKLLHERDEPITVGELVKLDNIRGIDDLYESMSDQFVDEKWSHGYKKLMDKYNPRDVEGVVISTTAKPDVRIKNKYWAKKVGVSEKTNMAWALPFVRVQWANGEVNSYYPHNLREI